MHPILAGPGPTPKELEALLPGTIAQRHAFDRFMYDVRAFGHFVIPRAALPEDIR